MKIVRFLKNLFPSKGDSRKQVLLKILFFICAAVFIVSLGFLLYDAVCSYEEMKSDSDLKNLYQPPASSSSSAAASSSSAPSVSASFTQLLKINSDIKGWITVPDTRIDHAVAQSTDNDYYLHKNFYKKADRYGCPFLDYRCVLNPMSRNLIIYGHHQSTFRDLDNYKQLSFYKKAPVVTFNTLYGNYQWKVFAVFIANTMPSEGPVFYYLKTAFSSDDDFDSYITECRRRSLLNIPVDVGTGDNILTLSTCNYDVKNARLVVMARLLRPGESVSPAAASVNPNPLMPDAWYVTHGGKKPVFSGSAASEGK